MQQVELLIENCDSITFNKEHIKQLQIEDTVGEKYIDFFKLIVKKEGDIPYNEFGINDYKPTSPFQRILNLSDITQIIVYKNDGTEKHLYINYKPVDKGILGSPNKNQSSYIDNEGNLKIIIKNR